MKIGVVGLGNMGGRIARRLVAAGEPVFGYDLDDEAMAGSGATPAPSVGALVIEVDVVMLSLPDSRAVEAVVYGDEEIVASCRESQIVVDLGTSSPASTARIHHDLATRGVAYASKGV